MQRDTARLAASGANETAGPAPLEQERRAPRLVRKRFLKLGKRTPPRHRSFIPAIPHGRLDHSHTICSSYLSQRDKPCLLHQHGEGRHTFAHIGVAAGKIHSHPGRRRDHRSYSAPSTRRSARTSTCASTRTEAPPGST